MPEYVNVDKAVAWVEKQKRLSKLLVIMMLQESASADVVEVVRCKDCRFCETFFPVKEIDKEPIQVWVCKVYQRSCKIDGFCSYGERRADHG